jgi:UDP-N-acetylglucosamine diphosphorylase/glucosamine-1-phosphate N-acetyltransferase
MGLRHPLIALADLQRRSLFLFVSRFPGAFRDIEIMSRTKAAKAPAGARETVRQAEVQRLAAELGLQLTPSLRAQLRRSIAEAGYEAARELALEALARPRAQALARQRVCQRLLLAGVALVDPATTYVEDGVVVGAGTVIQPNSVISGRTTIGCACHIGPNTIIRDSSIAAACRIVASVVESAVLEDEVTVGPFAHLREGTHLARGVHVGNFAEVKKARLGRGAKMGHFAYVGDAQVGDEVNIGAGTVTCNYDGVGKHRTVVGKGAFIGSDTMLVAPVKVGDGATTGAGSVVTRDVPPDSVAVGIPARARLKRRRKGG